MPCSAMLGCPATSPGCPSWLLSAGLACNAMYVRVAKPIKLWANFDVLGAQRVRRVLEGLQERLPLLVRGQGLDGGLCLAGHGCAAAPATAPHAFAADAHMRCTAHVCTMQGCAAQGSGGQHACCTAQGLRQPAHLLLDQAQALMLHRIPLWRLVPPNVAVALPAALGGLCAGLAGVMRALLQRSRCVGAWPERALELETLA